MKKLKMPESTYIAMTDLEKAVMAKTILSDIVPSINPYIDSDEHRTVMVLLAKWKDSIRNDIDVRG